MLSLATHCILSSYCIHHVKKFLKKTFDQNLKCSHEMIYYFLVTPKTTKHFVEK